jgi:GNAT superfamily N-acetyltransferase
MDMLIHKAAPDDITFCHHLTELEDWNYSYDEMTTLYATPGATFFIARDEVPVGMVATFLCGPTAWLGLLIVRYENRGEGIGTLLMKQAMHHVKSHGVTTMRLEAVQDAVPLYERLGFTPVFESLRMKGRSNGTPEHRNTPSPHLIEDIACFDAPYYGLSRLHFLHQWATLSTVIVVRKTPAITGYIMVRQASSHKIGPCVAQNKGVFRQLLQDALTQLEGEVTVGIPAVNVEGISVLKSFRFMTTSTSVRMVWGTGEYGGTPHHIFAIGGPEKG